MSERFCPLGNAAAGRTSGVPGFRVAFGSTGLAAAWCSCVPEHRIDLVVWTLAAVVWSMCLVDCLLAGMIVSALRSATTRPPGGLAAVLAPVSLMLLLARRGSDPSPAVVGLWVCVVVLAVALGVSAVWKSIREARRVVPDGEIFLPLVTAPLVVSITSSQLGIGRGVAVCLCVAGAAWSVLMVWMLIGVVVSWPPPKSKVTSLAIPMGSPALAGMAWLTWKGREVDAVALGLVGLTLVALATLLALVWTTARTLVWSVSLWAFTFPVASIIAYSAEMARLIGWTVVTVLARIALIALTAFVVALISSHVRSLAWHTSSSNPTKNRNSVDI